MFDPVRSQGKKTCRNGHKEMNSREREKKQKKIEHLSAFLLLQFSRDIYTRIVQLKNFRRFQIFCNFFAWNQSNSINPIRNEIRQSKINSCSVAGPIGQMNRRPIVSCSKYYFFSWFLAEFFAKILSIYLFILFKKYKNKSKEFWVP